MKSVYRVGGMPFVYGAGNLFVELVLFSNHEPNGTQKPKSHR
jgi:hypothetical protein